MRWDGSKTDSFADEGVEDRARARVTQIFSCDSRMSWHKTGDVNMQICQIWRLAAWQIFKVWGHAQTHKSTENHAQRHEICRLPAQHVDAFKPRIGLISLYKSILYIVYMHHAVELPLLGTKMTPRVHGKNGLSWVLSRTAVQAREQFRHPFSLGKSSMHQSCVILSILIPILALKWVEMMRQALRNTLFLLLPHSY